MIKEKEPELPSASNLRDLLQKEYEVEDIIDKKVIKGEWHYLIKWKHFPKSQNTWEPFCNVKDLGKLLQKFEKRWENRHNEKIKRSKKFKDDFIVNTDESDESSESESDSGKRRFDKKKKHKKERRRYTESDEDSESIQEKVKNCQPKKIKGHIIVGGKIHYRVCWKDSRKADSYIEKSEFEMKFPSMSRDYVEKNLKFNDRVNNSLDDYYER